MKTIQRYIAGGVLMTFVMTLVVFTFVMSIGVAFKVTDLLARGVSWRLISGILLHGVPPALTFSIPMSILTSCLLVFGRLSADGEVTAMKSCGLSMGQIIKPVLLISLLVSIVCLYVNTEMAPRSYSERRKIIARLGVETPLELLDAGRFIDDFPGFTIFIGKRKGNELKDIIIYEMKDNEVVRQLRAKRGVARKAENGKDLEIDLFGARVDPWYDDKPGFFEECPVKIPGVFEEKKRSLRSEGMTVAQLVDRIRNTRERYPQLEEEDVTKKRMKLLVELNKRFALSAACFAFVMLGIPLGIKTSRKESSVGVAISLVLVFVFFLFVIVAESLAKYPALQPHLIIWLPVAVSLVLGGYLVKRWN